MAIKTTLTCVLLLHHEKVEAQFPDHRLVSTMYDSLDTAGATQQQMEMWISCVNQDFIQQNGQYLNGSALVGDAAHHSIHEMLHQMARGMAGQTQMLVNVLRELQTLNGKVNGFERKFEEHLARTLNQQTNHNNELRAPQQQQQEQPLDNHDEDRLDQRLPPELTESASKMKISSLFFIFYASQFMLIETRPNSPERRRLSDMTRTITFMKRFLPDGSVITRRPNNADANEYLTWSRLISRYSQIAEKRIVEFLEQQEIREHWCSTRPRHPRVAGEAIDHDGQQQEEERQRKKRKIMPYFQSIIKKLQAIPETSYPTPTGIQDENMLD
jgi:hypothetical protein